MNPYDPVQYGYLLPQWRTIRQPSGQTYRQLEYLELWRAGQVYCCVGLLEGPRPIPYDAYQYHMISQTLQEVH